MNTPKEIEHARAISSTPGSRELVTLLGTIERLDMSKIEVRAGHTPGPWSVETVGPERYVCTDADVDICCVLNPYPLKNEYEGMSDAEVSEAQSSRKLANARLIAAAPELLESLERLQTRLFMLEGYSDLYQLASNAIAKATPPTVKEAL